MCFYEERCKPEEINDSMNSVKYSINEVFTRIIKNQTLMLKYNISILSNDPFVLVFNNFIDNTIIEPYLKINHDFKPSYDGGKLQADFRVERIVSQTRTS